MTNAPKLIFPLQPEVILCLCPLARVTVSKTKQNKMKNKPNGSSSVLSFKSFLHTIDTSVGRVVVLECMKP